jgi:hypothetical protein
LDGSLLREQKEEGVMKRQIVPAILLGLFIATVGSGALTELIYKTTGVGDGRWRYTHDESSIGLPMPVEESTISFDFGLYDNLAVEAAEPLASGWGEIVWHLEPVLEDDRAHDPNARGGGTIEVPANRAARSAGSTVSLHRSGGGDRRSPSQEIGDPESFESQDEPWIIPEPATLLLLALGALALRKKQW